MALSGWGGTRRPKYASTDPYGIDSYGWGDRLNLDDWVGKPVKPKGTFTPEQITLAVKILDRKFRGEGHDYIVEMIVEDRAMRLRRNVNTTPPYIYGTFDNFVKDLNNGAFHGSLRDSTVSHTRSLYEKKLKDLYEFTEQI